MTDDSLGITSGRVTSLARLYFDHLGATVEATDDRWRVEFPESRVPEFVADAVDDRTLDVAIGEQSDDGPVAPVRLAPQTDFTHQLIDAAATVAPVGRRSLTADQFRTETVLPDWIEESPATVTTADFLPYYDGTLLTVWVRVEIETPSQYQREHLYRITVDPETDEAIGGETDAIEAVLDSHSSAHSQIDSSGKRDGFDSSTLARTVSVAREEAVEAAHREIETVREGAVRTASASFDDYRQRRQKQIERIQTEVDAAEEELSTITAKLTESPTGTRRVQLLERREELQQDREALSEKLSAIRAEESHGYRDRRDELADRHAVGVHTRPVAVTSLSVERGDLEVALEERGETATLRLPFGLGGGIRETPTCPACDSQYAVTNYPRVLVDGIACERCTH